MSVNHTKFVRGVPIINFPATDIPDINAADEALVYTEPVDISLIRIDRSNSLSLWRSRDDCLQTSGLQHFNNLLHLGNMVPDKFGSYEEGLELIWMIDGKQFDEIKKPPQYELLKRCMGELARKAISDTALMHSFHNWSNGFTEDPHGLHMMFLALGDLATESVESNEFQMLDALSAMENLSATYTLSTVLEHVGEAGAEPSIGTQKAANAGAEAAEDEAGVIEQTLEAIDRFSKLPPERVQEIAALMVFDTERFLSDIGELLTTADEPVLSLMFMDFLDKLDDDLLEQTLLKIKRIAVEQASGAGIYVLGMFARQGGVAHQIMNELEPEHFMPAIRQYRTRGMLKVMAYDAARHAIGTISVDDDETDIPYLKNLVAHGNNIAARQRLAQLREPKDHKLIPFKAPGE